MTELILPTLSERVTDYTNALDVERRRKLAEFIGVQWQTVRQWHKGRSIPLGKRALQLHYLLEWVGFGDHQWRSTNESVEIVGRALTFGLITEEDLAEAFKDECQLTRVIQMMSGHKHIAPACQKIFDEFAAIHSWNIKQAQAKWDDLRITNPQERLIAELANRLQSILPLVKDMASDKWTEGDRYELRERAGRSTVFELYNALGELCGERARQSSVAERARAAAASLLVKGE
jgi:hypothetical protein